MGAVDKFQCRVSELLVSRFHPLAGQGARVLDLAVRERTDDAAGSETLPERGVLGIEVGFRLLLGIEVIEVAEEFVESMIAGQELILVAQVVLAELPGGITVGLEQLRDGGILGAQADVRPRHAHFQQAGAQGMLACDEGGASRGAALLTVVIGEHGALVGDTIDVRGAATKHAAVVDTEVGPADVVAPYDQDIGLFRCGRNRTGEQQNKNRRCQRRHSAENASGCIHHSLP